MAASRDMRMKYPRTPGSVREEKAEKSSVQSLDRLKNKLSALSRSSSRELRISCYQLFSVVYFSRGTLPKKRNGEKGHYWGI